MNLDFILNNLTTQNKRVISKAISIVENEYPASEKILNAIHKHTGKAYRIGLTGPPGAGKSTIVNQLTKRFIEKQIPTAIIAVDPTSPFSGGALLGDRIRMSEIGTNQYSFIRSLASRGSMGGLSRKASDIADILDAAGYEFIIFETVGVGQSEIDIAKAADTTVVSLVPESGDSIQAMKAGLMEIADIFLINKCDRPGAERSFTSLKNTLALKDISNNEWKPPILKSTAVYDEGIDSLLETIHEHRNYLINSGSLRKKEKKR